MKATLSQWRRYLSAGYGAVSRRFDEVRLKRWQDLIARNKQRLADAASAFVAHPDTVFVFQTFNKADLLPKVLEPFLKMAVGKVIVLADGCCDATLATAHALLPGRDHFVVACNDTYETKNYRMAIAMAQALAAKYVLLLQDDDLYGTGLAHWIVNARAELEADDRLAIIGGNDGFHLGHYPERIDEGLMSASFDPFQDERGRGYRLGVYEEMIFSNAGFSPPGGSREYVAWVNRAPQMIRVNHALEAGFFPREIEPYQYDDHFNSLSAWVRGWRVLHMPIAGKVENVGIGGMRAFNGVTINRRPAHFVKNWQWVARTFERAWLDGVINDAVSVANRGIATQESASHSVAGSDSQS